MHTPPNPPDAQDVISVDPASSAITGDFPVDKEATYAATGLFGCTSVIAISRLGVWVSHIWQKPFEPFAGGGLGSPMFQQEVIDFLRNGNQAFDRLGTPVTSPGLLGLNKLALKNDKNQPQFLIMTPRSIEANAVPGQLRYPAEIAAITAQLNNIAPGVPVIPLDYAALQQIPASEPKEPKGKIMIQYSPNQPFQGCEQIPQYQVWVEGNHLSNADDQWLISNRKRDTSAPLCSTTLATSARSTDTSAPSSGTGKPSSDVSTATSQTVIASSASPPKPINTILPGKPSATPATSAHNLTIWQGLGIDTTQPDVYLYANVSDNVGLVLATAHAKLDWSKNLTLITDTTPKHTIVITPTSSVDNNARKRVSGALGNKPQFTKGSVLVAVDNLPVFDVADINEGNQEPWKQDKPGDWFKTVFGSKSFAMSVSLSIICVCAGIEKKFTDVISCCRIVICGVFLHSDAFESALCMLGGLVYFVDVYVVVLSKHPSANTGDDIAARAVIHRLRTKWTRAEGVVYFIAIYVFVTTHCLHRLILKQEDDAYAEWLAWEAF